MSVLRVSKSGLTSGLQLYLARNYIYRKNSGIAYRRMLDECLGAL